MGGTPAAFVTLELKNDGVGLAKLVVTFLLGLDNTLASETGSGLETAASMALVEAPSTPNCWLIS